MSASSEENTMPAVAKQPKVETKPKKVAANAPTKAAKAPAETTDDQHRLVLCIGPKLKKAILEVAASISEAANGIPVTQVDASRVMIKLGVVLDKDGKATLRPIDPSVLALSREHGFDVRVFVPKAQQQKKWIAEIAESLNNAAVEVNLQQAARTTLCAGIMIVNGKATLRPPL